MPVDVSIDSRFTIAGISYTFMGPMFARGRDFSRKKFGITNESSETKQFVHDTVYTGTFNLILAPLIYLSMGSNLKQAIIGGISAAVLSPVMGPVMGYSIDVGRDLTGLKECERKTYPEEIRRQKPIVKKGLAGLLVAGSLVTMAGLYAIAPNKGEINESQLPSQIEQVVETSEY